MNKKIIISVFSLSAGALIYLLSDVHPYFSFGISLDFLKDRFISSYLPDMLWALAFAFTISVFTDNKQAIFLIVTICGFLMELFQYLNLIKGTGDLADVFIEIVGVLLFFILENI